MADENLDNPVLDDPIVDKPEPELINQAAYTSTRNDMMKYKRESQTKDAEISGLKAKIEAKETADLESQSKYKELFEAEKGKRETAEADRDTLTNAVLNEKRDNAVRDALAKAGANPELLPLLMKEDRSSVIVETTDQGNINTLGVDNFIETLKSKYGESAFPPTDAPTLNTDTSTVAEVIESGQKLAPTAVLELQRKDPAAYKTYMKSQMTGT